MAAEGAERGIGKERLLSRNVYCKPTILLRGRLEVGFEVARRGYGNWGVRDGRRRDNATEKTEDRQGER